LEFVSSLEHFSDIRHIDVDDWLKIDVLVRLEIDSLVCEVQQTINRNHRKDLLHLHFLLSDGLLCQVFELSFVKDMIVSQVFKETIDIQFELSVGVCAVLLGHIINSSNGFHESVD